MNDKIAKILYEIGVLYDLKGVAFKPRAYERASNSIKSLGEDVRAIYKRDGLEGLENIPGVGKRIAKHIEEYIKTKHIKEYDRMKKRLPVDIFGITSIEGVGPHTLKLLYKKLAIKTRAQLKKAARAGKLAKIRGIGAKGQMRILRNMSYQPTGKEQRFLPGAIWPSIRAVTDQIESWPHVKRLELVGSLRRMKETIGDMDMLAISDDAEDTVRRFVSMSQTRSVYVHGEHNARIRLTIGIDADLWVIAEDVYGAAMIAWTGDKAHNIHLREIAKRKGYMLSDFGLFKKTKLIASRTEKEVYAKMGMAWIPPELRVDGGEIEAAINEVQGKKGGLPNLVGYSDIKGDLHVHTDWTDGTASILEMARAAEMAGLEYIAITDHSHSLGITHGLDAKKIKKQWAEIDRVQKKIRSVKLLKGTECDILRNGNLDFSDDILSQLDVVGASVHSSFEMSSKDQTDRMVKAMENPNVDIICHPTGRLIQKREPYAVDLEGLIKGAKRTKTVLEANAQPWRLDLNGENIRTTINSGVRISIGTDSHTTDSFGYMRWGIGQARRGWAEKKDVINTRTYKQMLKLLK